MASPSPVKASDALDELVNQFSDPLSFFRELIQNSLDAGSAEVEVRIEFEPGDGPGDPGAMIIHVDDWGDGMDKEIIDKRLTRLFSSAKDGDMTKIGKFGIGFVSVFAIDPEAVVVDTSREGEHWRVIFDEKRTFSCLRREHPVDGTKVSIYKTVTRQKFDEFVAAAERTVRYWCKHTRGEVRFQGELINEPFDLPHPCKIERDDGFSRIVVAHPVDDATFFGFYNQGLTLVEGRRGQLDGIAFKVSSPHLEHTLTRDNVIQDDAFHKVLGDVNALVVGELCERVFAWLAEVEFDPVANDPVREYWYGALLWHLRRGHAIPSATLARPVLPLCGGGKTSIRDLTSVFTRTLRKDVVLWSPVENPATAQLSAGGEKVLHLPRESAGLDILHLLAARGLEADDQRRHRRVRRTKELWCAPILREPATDGAVTRLGRALERLLGEHGAKLSYVGFGHFDYPDSPITERVAITQSEPGELTRLEEASQLGRWMLAARRALIVNLDHPAVADLVGLAVQEPELAAYKLVKLFFLGRELDVELAADLAQIALQQRWQG